MKSIGIVRKLDELGRVVIPKELRDAFGWNPQDPMEMLATEDGVFIRKYKSVDEKNQTAIEELIGLSFSSDLNAQQKKIIKNAVELLKKQ